MNLLTRREDRGVALVIAAIAMFVILVCVGLAIDGFRLFDEKISKQNQSEFVAISVLRAYKASGDDAPTALAAGNASQNSSVALQETSAGCNPTISSTICVEFGHWDAGAFNVVSAHADAVRVTIGNETGFIRPFFMQLVGIREIRTYSSAIAFYDVSKAGGGNGITALNNPFAIVREAGQ